jgi:hypothetical protein
MEDGGEEPGRRLDWRVTGNDGRARRADWLGAGCSYLTLLATLGLTRDC